MCVSREPRRESSQSGRWPGERARALHRGGRGGRPRAREPVCIHRPATPTGRTRHEESGLQMQVKVSACAREQPASVTKVTPCFACTASAPRVEPPPVALPHAWCGCHCSSHASSTLCSRTRSSIPLQRRWRYLHLRHILHYSRNTGSAGLLRLRTSNAPTGCCQPTTAIARKTARADTAVVACCKKRSAPSPR